MGSMVRRSKQRLVAAADVDMHKEKGSPDEHEDSIEEGSAGCGRFGTAAVGGTGLEDRRVVTARKSAAVAGLWLATIVGAGELHSCRRLWTRGTLASLRGLHGVCAKHNRNK